jgi:hypothetical protein
MTQNNPVAGPQTSGRTAPDVPPLHHNPASITPERAAAAAAAPKYHRGRLTREGMETVHAAGGSVLYNGQVIPPGHPLPSVEDLAGTDQAALTAAEESLDAEQQRIDSRRAAINRQRKAAEEMRKASDEAAKQQERAQQQQRTQQQHERTGGTDEQPTFGTAEHPLSYFDGKSDEEILNEDGIGPATLDKIRAAQRRK